MKPYNVVVRSADLREELPIGKVCEVDGEPVVHSDVYGHYRRFSLAAWGVRYALLRVAQEVGADAVHFYRRDADRTLRVSLDDARRFGVAGKADRFGGTVNVPEDAWEVLDGKLPVPWVPDESRRVVDATEPPWPMAERPTGKPVASGVVQGGLFGDRGW